jgi:hypothetical protein
LVDVSHGSNLGLLLSVAMAAFGGFLPILYGGMIDNVRIQEVIIPYAAFNYLQIDNVY